LLIFWLFVSSIFAEGTASVEFVLVGHIVVVRLNLDECCCFVEVVLLEVRAV
jgi:hypothetical protein